MSDRIFFSTPKDSRAKIAEFMKVQNEKYQSTAADDDFRRQWRESAKARQETRTAEAEAEKERLAELAETVQLDDVDRRELDRQTKERIATLIASGADYREAVETAEAEAKEAGERRKREKASNIVMGEALRRNRQGATVSMGNGQSPESREMNALFRRAAGRR